MFNVTHSKATNIRELTKKDKLLGLNLTSWVFCGMVVLPIANMNITYAFYLLLALLVFFYVAEFFDEDITDIISANFSVTGLSTYYA